MPEGRPGFLKGAHLRCAVHHPATRATLSPGTLPALVAAHADRDPSRVPHPENLPARHSMIAEHTRGFPPAKHRDLLGSRLGYPGSNGSANTVAGLPVAQLLGSSAPRHGW